MSNNNITKRLAEKLLSYAIKWDNDAQWFICSKCGKEQQLDKQVHHSGCFFDDAISVIEQDKK